MFFIAKIIAKIQFHLALQKTNSLIFSGKIIAKIIAIYCAKVGDVTGTLYGDTDSAAVFLEDWVGKANAL